MRAFAIILFAALCAAPSCQGNPTPVPPPPSVWPPANGDVCEAQCKHVVDELHCPGFGPTCAANCRSLDFQLAAHSQNPVDHACVVTAPGCPEAMRCH
jgi:hypothetical protein